MLAGNSRISSPRRNDTKWTLATRTAEVAGNAEAANLVDTELMRLTVQKQQNFLEVLLQKAAVFRKKLFRRLDAQHRAMLFVGEHIQQAVRPLANIANSLPHVHQQRFPPQFFHLLVEQNPFHMARARNLAGP